MGETKGLKNPTGHLEPQAGQGRNSVPGAIKQVGNYHLVSTNLNQTQGLSPMYPGCAAVETDLGTLPTVAGPV